MKRHTGEPATYIHWWSTNADEMGRALIQDYNALQHIISARKHRKRKKQLLRDDASENTAPNAESMTEDAMENTAHNTENMIWDVSGYDGKKGEDKLRMRLRNVFGKLQLTSNVQRYAAISELVETKGVGHLIGFGYTVFNAWMQGKRATSKLIAAPNKQAMIAYVEQNEDGVLGAAGIV